MIQAVNSSSLIIGITISGNEGLHSLSSSVNIMCSSDLDVQYIRWLNLSDGRELRRNNNQQSLTLSVQSVTPELDGTMYTCEVRVRLATGLATIMQTITIFVDSKYYYY